MKPISKPAQNDMERRTPQQRALLPSPDRSLSRPRALPRQHPPLQVLSNLLQSEAARECVVPVDYSLGNVRWSRRIVATKDKFED